MARKLTSKRRDRPTAKITPTDRREMQ